MTALREHGPVPRKRIAHAIFSNPWSRLAGGGQICVEHLARAMARQGHEVHLICSYDPGDELPENLPYNVHATPVRRIGELNLDCLAHRRAYLALAPRLDHVFVHGENALLFDLPRKQPPRRTAVFHACGLPGADAQRSAWRNRGLGERLNHYALSAVLRRVEDIVCFSNWSLQTVHQALGRCGIPTHKIEPGVPEPFRLSDAVPAVYRPGAPLSIISWGRLETVKGYDVLLDAMGRLKNEGLQTRLRLFGHGSQKPALRRQAAAHGLAVDFAGKQPQEAIARACCEAHLAVFPSRDESFGLSIAESAASGLPTMAAVIPAVREVLRNGELGTLFRPESPAALAEAIRGYVAAPAAAARYAQAARNRARAIYDWDICAARLLSLPNHARAPQMATGRDGGGGYRGTRRDNNEA